MIVSSCPPEGLETRCYDYYLKKIIKWNKDTQEWEVEEMSKIKETLLIKRQIRLLKKRINNMIVYQQWANLRFEKAIKYNIPQKIANMLTNIELLEKYFEN